MNDKTIYKNRQKCFTHEYQILSDFSQEMLIAHDQVVCGGFCLFSHSTNHLAGGVPFAVPNNPLFSLPLRVGDFHFLGTWQTLAKVRKPNQEIGALPADMSPCSSVHDALARTPGVSNFWQVELAQI